MLIKNRSIPSLLKSLSSSLGFLTDGNKLSDSRDSTSVFLGMVETSIPSNNI